MNTHFVDASAPATHATAERKIRIRARAIAATLALTFVSFGAGAEPGIAVVESGGSTSVAESGAIDRYTVALTEKPKEEVVITFVLDGQVLLFPRVLKFQPETFDTPQPVTVSALDDETPEESPHWCSLSHNASSADPDYNLVNQAPVQVSIDDEDLASVVVAQSGGDSHVTEKGPPDSYTLALSTRPNAEVTITVRPATPPEAGEQPGPAGSAQLTVSPDSVTFTPENWQPRTITLTAVDDEKVDGTYTETLVHAVTSADTAYSEISMGKVQTVEVSVADDDGPGLLLSESGGATRVVEAGAADSYTLALATEPATSVSVTLVVSDPDQVTVIPPRVTFHPLDYATPRTITVSAVDDEFGEGPQTVTIAHSVSSTDSAYREVTVRPVVVRVTDNDLLPAVLVNESGGGTGVTEGGAPDSYTLFLAARPAGEVAIDIQAGSQINASPNRVTFSPDDFDEPRTVMVTALDDRIAEGTRHETVTHAVTSAADQSYHGIATDPVVVTVSDNDVRGVIITESGGGTAVTEGGASDDYTLALNSQPEGAVEIALSAGDGITVDPATLQFTPADFGPRKVLVRAPDSDRIAEGRRYVTISHRVITTDTGYQSVAVAPVTVTRTDNDQAGVSVTESDGTTELSEDGLSDSYDLVLLSQPVRDVTITLRPGDQMTAEPASVTFTAANYNVAQTITLSAVNDSVVEGAHLATLRHQIDTEDDSYGSVSANDVIAVIADNDQAPVEPVVDNDVTPQSGDAGGGGSGSLSWTTLAGLLLGCLSPLLACLRKGQG